jgi:hypothetical protein
MSKTVQAIKLSEFSVEDITISPPKVNQNGGKNISLGYNADGTIGNFVFQTPRMLSFGINKWVDPNKPESTPSFSVTLSFMGMADNPKLQEFHQVLQDIDNWAIDTASKNSWEWLARKNLSRETLSTIYTPCVKVPLDLKTGEPTGKPHSMKSKFKTNKGDITSVFFDKERNIIPMENVETVFNKGSHVRALIQCTGFWVIAGKFGLSWKVLQMIVEPRVTGFGNVCAITDEDDETN